MSNIFEREKERERRKKKKWKEEYIYMYLKCLGSENLFLKSARLSPKIGASTVRTSALKPAFSARLIKFNVMFRSV